MTAERQQLLEQFVTLLWRLGESQMLEAVRAAAAFADPRQLELPLERRRTHRSGNQICDVESQPRAVWLIVIPD